MDKFSLSDRINKAVYDMGIFSYRQLIHYLPRKYDDLTLTVETNLDNKERVVIVGKVVGTPLVYKYSYKTTLTKFTFISKNENIFYCEAWNRPYLSKMLTNGELFTIVASFDKKKNILNIINITKGEITDGEYIKPIYTLPRNVENFEFVKLVSKAFKNVTKEEVDNVIPSSFNKKYSLVDHYDALKICHKPYDLKNLYQGIRLIKYEECLLFSLKNQLIRKHNKSLFKTNKSPIDIQKVKDFIRSLNFKLTNDQKYALKEILEDMNKTSLMYRLLQGDVGTGKTLVASIALFANYLRGDQGALLAPTDALARQHYHSIACLFKDTDMKIALLLGSTPLKERAIIREGLINNKINIVIGTHVLFSKDINYLSLGLAVIDEQHKFGVNQRETLASKGEHADLLLMSATPIPRSMALTLYGDLDVSILAEFPFKERNVVTKIVKDNDKEIFSSINESLSNDKRVFIIAPLITDNNTDNVSVEKLFQKYSLKYPTKVSLLHGKLDDDDKNFALSNFIKGVTPILISTTVVEVGIDIKNSNLMIIYEPTHFGLASLHQLRGRIGRDGQLAKCLLVTNSIDEDDIDKLSVLVNSNDGFYIAEEDLRRRGPGDLVGVKQSGIANFTYVNLVNDFKMFEAARNDAIYILENESNPEFKHILALAHKEIERS